MTETCSCKMRKKIIIQIVDIVDENICGVSDSELADFFNCDLSVPSGKPVLQIRHCPWCGKLAPKPEILSDFEVRDEEESDESWRGSTEE